MKKMIIKRISGFFCIAFLAISCNNMVSQDKEKKQNYEPAWESLKKHQTPEWLRDGKFGIYTHWGVYAVHGMGPNGTWYAYHVYRNKNGWQRKDFEERFGKLSDGAGYKDLIPLFTAEKFDAEEWADLFAKSGAKFAGPVVEHHDGFAMWDTEYSEWNAAKMGPKRDVVGELEKAIKAREMKFVTAFHHAASWFYFPVWDEQYDCSDPEYSGLYGPIHERGVKPNKEFLDEWYGKIIEVIDNYDPDFLWFDFALDNIREDYIKNFVAYYYNKALERKKEVVITYKHHDLPSGVGVLDLELGQEPDLTHHDWITDSSVDDQGAWSYVKAAKFKPLNRLIDNLIDRISKNGYLLLNVGPKPDGTIPEEAKELLLGIGKWLKINGEAVYGTTAWTFPGEGPTSVRRSGDSMFNESDTLYTSRDIRFTVKADTLYAFVLDWPGEKAVIPSLGGKTNEFYGLYENEVKEISMLGDNKPLEWAFTEEGLVIEPPAEKPCEYAFVFKIVRTYR